MRLITKSGRPLAVAETIPAARSAHLCRDPGVLEVEQRKILARTWQLAGHVSRLESTGSERAGRPRVDLVANQQAGLETRGFEPGPLSRTETALGLFADKIRADLGEDP
jgi:hypothetical protein